jgi:hypothetical protein
MLVGASTMISFGLIQIIQLTARRFKRKTRPPFFTIFLKITRNHTTKAFQLSHGGGVRMRCGYVELGGKQEEKEEIHRYA